jgi:hypothetical protein
VPPIPLSIAWVIWDADIRPALIPRDVINRLADDLIARYGPDAETQAFSNESYEWYRSNAFERGKWHRIRRELWRRYERGEWTG